MRAVVAGGGIFGVTAALALRAARPRGHAGRSRAAAPPARRVDRHQQGRAARLRRRRGVHGARRARARRLAALEPGLAGAALPRDRRDVPVARADAARRLRARQLRAACAPRPPLRAARRRRDRAPLPGLPARRACRRLLQPAGRLGRVRRGGRRGWSTRRRAAGVEVRGGCAAAAVRRARRPGRWPGAGRAARPLDADLVRGRGRRVGRAALPCAGRLRCARRPAGLPPAPGRSGAVRGRALPGVRRRHRAHRLLRLPGQPRRRWSRSRTTAPASRST